VRTVAALFVATDGCYFGLPDVDPWDVTRDARKYAGPHPVVAHPPCQLWVNFAALNFKRYGGEHNRPGNDGGCFAKALYAVQRWGGVLEHPAFTNAYRAFGIGKPECGTWTWLGELPRGEAWTCEVWQRAYGHRARKRTWLYFVGPERPPELDWTRTPGVAQVGWFDRIKPTLSKREAMSTPPAFRDMLLDLARRARPSGADSKIGLKECARRRARWRGSRAMCVACVACAASSPGVARVRPGIRADARESGMSEVSNSPCAR
jgi:hypothetical protein